MPREGAFCKDAFREDAGWAPVNQHNMPPFDIGRERNTRHVGMFCKFVLKMVFPRAQRHFGFGCLAKEWGDKYKEGYTFFHGFEDRVCIFSVLGESVAGRWRLSCMLTPDVCKALPAGCGVRSVESRPRLQ